MLQFFLGTSPPATQGLTLPVISSTAVLYPPSLTGTDGTLAYLQTTVDIVDRLEYTFAGRNFGAAADDRVILAVVHARRAGAKTVTGVTIGGVAATEIVQAGQATNGTTALFLAAVPSGSTGDVVVTFDQTVLRCVLELYRATGIGSIASQTRAVTTSTLSTTLDIPAGGVAVAAGQGFESGSPAFSWTGLTERSDGLAEGNSLSYASASGEFATAQDGLAVTATPDATLNAPTYVAAVFGPASAGTVLSLPTIANTSALYAPSLAVGAVSLTLPHLASTATLFAPSLSQGTVSLTLPHISSTASLFAPSLTVGAVSLTLPAIASTAELFAPSLTTGVMLSLPHIGSGAILFPPSLTLGAVGLTLPHIASTAQVYAPSLSTVTALTVPHLPSGSTLYPPSLVPGPVSLTLPAIASTAELFAPSLIVGAGPAQSLALPHIASEAAIYAPSVALAATGVGPQVVSAAVSPTGLVLTITFDRLIFSADGANGWTVTADDDPVTVASAAITGKTLALTLSAPIYDEQTVLLSYSTS